MGAESNVERRRRELGAGAVFSLSEAAELLPMRTAEAVEWLRAGGLVRQLQGREVIIWGDVLARLRDGDPAPANSTPPTRGFKRAQL